MSVSICGDTTACFAENIQSEGTRPGWICNVASDKKSHTIGDLMHTESIYCAAVTQHKTGNSDMETVSQTEGEAKRGEKLSKSARKRRPRGLEGRKLDQRERAVGGKAG